MALFKRILVDIDSDAASHPALERAVLLARGGGATVTVTDVLAGSPYERRHWSADLEEAVLAGRRSQLTRIASMVRHAVTDAKLLVGRPATALTQEVIRSGHDLLMRSHARGESGAAASDFGAVDMELLRTCPCAVMLVRPSSAAPQPRIAAAIDAAARDQAEQALNVKIATAALDLSELLAGVPMLLHAWSPFGERMIRAHASEDAFAGYVEDARSRAAADLNTMAEALGSRLAGVRIVQRRGRPEDVIIDAVTAEGIDLLVMGTVARSGVPGLVWGNTAERVLRKLRCSVLTLKPDSFVSSV